MGGGGFGFGDAAEALQEDGEAGVGEDVVGRVGDEVLGEGQGFVEMVCVFEGAEQGVGCGGVVRLKREGVVEVGDRLGGRAGGHVVEGAVEGGFGGGGRVGGHGMSIDGGVAGLKSGQKQIPFGDDKQERQARETSKRDKQERQARETSKKTGGIMAGDEWPAPLEVAGEGGEGGEFEEVLAGGRRVEDLVFEHPGEVVGDEDGVQAGGEGGVDV